MERRYDTAAPFWTSEIFPALEALTSMKAFASGCAVMLLLSIVNGVRAETVLESGPQQTRLLELYTSEGCSSCPPAEAWLSKLKNDPRLWRDFAPLAFHVDYWDRLGWRDPYASKQWTARQYQYSAQWKSGSVYTPGFVLDGREWRNSSAPLASDERPGVLRITVSDNDLVTAQFQPERRYNTAVPWELHVARLGFGLTTHVKAGENSGRKLEHDFVVLSLTSEKMRDGNAQLRLGGTPPAPNSQPSAIVAWVTEVGQLAPIQAAGGWVR